MNKVPLDVREREKITKVIERYISGAISGQGNDMKPAFHKDATIFGYVGADLLASPVATVRLELENWTGNRFSDLFTLLKIEAEWKITNKVFHLHA